MHPTPFNPTVIPWHDETTMDQGFSARSEYVEWYWLPVLGPSATWLLRRIDCGFDEFPNGYVLDSLATAKALGIAARDAAGTIFSRAIERLQTFGIAQQRSESLAVRRMLPSVSQRQIERLPAHLRTTHADWLRGRALTK